MALANAGTRDGVTFRLGGFETPTPGGRPPAVIRAFNVLRQYDESAVVDSWRIMQDRLQPGGALVEGTCNEVGRVASWVTLDDRRTAHLHGVPAGRRPRAAEHRRRAAAQGVDPPERPRGRVHAFLLDLDRSWAVAAPLGTYGPRQRWIATVHGMRDRGWPVLHGVSRWRLGELSVPWSAVAPA